MANKGDPDPFDSLLHLEEQHYEEGYQHGHKEGVAQSRLEARVFGIQKGYEKYMEVGKLYAKARLWAARSAMKCSTVRETSLSATRETGANDGQETIDSLPALSTSARLQKHIQILLNLTDPMTLSRENTDDTVSQLDDRIKRAEVKARIIEKIIGEETPSTHFRSGLQTNDTTMEDFGMNNAK